MVDTASPQENRRGIMTLSDTLAACQCDVQEDRWNGQENVRSNMPEPVMKHLGKIEHAEVVHHDDTHWRDEPKVNMRLCQMDEGRKKLVASKLKFGDAVKEAKRKQ